MRGVANALPQTDGGGGDGGGGDGGGSEGDGHVMPPLAVQIGGRVGSAQLNALVLAEAPHVEAELPKRHCEVMSMQPLFGLIRLSSVGSVPLKELPKRYSTVSCVRSPISVGTVPVS